jgi:hypothetical protein
MMFPTFGGHDTTKIIIMKTTALGILTIVATASNVGIQLLSGDSPDFPAAFASIIAGVGLIKAADAK